MDDEHDQTGLTGLHNLGNTCYMNAALQALSNCPPLTRYFKTCSQAVACRLVDRGRQSIARCYAQLVEDLWHDGCRRPAVVDPTHLAAQFRSVYPAFRLHSQQDAQEFLRCFLDRLHEELCEPVVSFGPEAAANASSIADSGVPAMAPTMTSSQISHFSDASTCDLYSSQSAHALGELLANDESYETAEEDEIAMEFDLLTDASAAYSSLAPPDVVPQPEPESRRQSLAPPPHLFHQVSATGDAQWQPRRSIISDLFDGQIRSSVKCLTCGNVSSTRERFQDLSLPIPSYQDCAALRKSADATARSSSGYQGSSASWLGWLRSWLGSWAGPSAATPTLTDCLSAFFVADELKGNDMYSCSHCAKLRNGIRYAELLEPLPELLCIHLKRFRHDLSSGVSKIKQCVVYPLTGLDLRPWIVSTSDDLEKAADDDDDDDDEGSDNRTTLYDLVAVVQHEGGPAAGHYTALCRHDATGYWYEFDDDCCTRISLEKVARAQAYVLFYRRRPSLATAALLRQVASACWDEAPALAQSLTSSADCVHWPVVADACDAEAEADAGGPAAAKSRRSLMASAGHHDGASSTKRARRAKARSNRVKASRHADRPLVTSTARPLTSSPVGRAAPQLVYMSKQWLIRLQSLTAPGPISNYDFLCEHGAVQPRLFHGVTELVQRVPEAAWQLLSKAYGGGPACNQLYECHWCRAQAEQLRLRQQHELETYRRLEAEPCSDAAPCAVNPAWWRRWWAFVTNQASQSSHWPGQQPPLHSSTGVVLPPGPIDNLAIAAPANPGSAGIVSCGSSTGSSLVSAPSSPSQLAPAGSACCQLKAGCADSVRVRGVTWHFLVDTYGGGPQVSCA